MGDVLLKYARFDHLVVHQGSDASIILIPTQTVLDLDSKLILAKAGSMISHLTFLEPVFGRAAKAFLCC